MVESTKFGAKTAIDCRGETAIDFGGKKANDFILHIFVIIAKHKFDTTRDFLTKKGIKNQPADLNKEN